MTIQTDDRSERNGKTTVELVADLWFIVMSHLSPSDVVSLSQTCKTLYEYSRFHHVWHSALLEHRFLPNSYPHLRSAPTDLIRRQLLTTARLDAAFAQGILRPIRSYTFPLDFPGVFQGIKFIPGSKWLVLLFHSRTLNPARHSNICLFKPPLETSETDSTASSVTLQSEWCWLHLGQRDGPYKSSRGDNLMLLRTFVKNERRFAICHLDIKTPSIKIPFTVRTTCRVRNYVAAGDYFVYGWITKERKHMVRIMKLNEDYTKLVNDMTLEIDCPAGDDGRLMVRYDLRLSGKRPRLLFISTRLMAAYDISDSVLASASPSSSVTKLQPTWEYLPENVSFGRILRVFPEGAIVTLYEGKVRFIYPDLECAQPISKTVAMYNFSSPTPYSTKYPAVFTPQRIFWPLRFPRSLPASVGSKHLIETATLPEPKNEECHVDRVLVDHDDLSSTKGSLAYDAQDWDELTGKLCVRYVRSRFPHDDSWRKISWRITIMEMV